MGEGKIDLFEWLKFNIHGMYKQLNPPNYFDRYFCFEKNSKFKPETDHIGEMYTVNELLNQLYNHKEELQDLKGLGDYTELKREERKEKRFKKSQNHYYSDFNIKPTFNNQGSYEEMLS